MCWFLPYCLAKWPTILLYHVSNALLDMSMIARLDQIMHSSRGCVVVHGN